jgi:hypothetical protein
MFFLFAPAKCHLLSLLNGAGRLKCFLRGGDSRSVVGCFLVHSARPRDCPWYSPWLGVSKYPVGPSSVQIAKKMGSTVRQRGGGSFFFGGGGVLIR